MCVKTFYEHLQASPPQSGNFVKASVSDKKKFFENAMEESHKSSPKPGQFKLWSSPSIQKESRHHSLNQLYSKVFK